MNAIIKNYRRGHRTMNPHQVIVLVEKVASKAAAQRLVGKTATWSTKAGKKITGMVRAVHGDKGAVRIRFENPLPPQSIGTSIEIR